VGPPPGRIADMTWTDYAVYWTTCCTVISFGLLVGTEWGDRVCRVRDPLGNLWWIMTRLENVSAEEMVKRWGEKKYIDAMQYVQSAQFFPSNN